MNLPRNVLYYGRQEPLPVQMPLRAGPLSLVYEDGDLRYIKLGEQEIVRRLYVAIRDHNWGTIAPRLSNVRIETTATSFAIDYDVENIQNEIAFAWHGAIRGQADGVITFSMAGEARSAFRRNRIGFCLLHPSECAGKACRVTMVDGVVQHSAFPRYISPHQPFKEMRAIAHEVTPGLWAEVEFAGDIFEMEDQRNWTDASFKTYCTPLRLPYPVTVQPGDKVAQSITLRLLNPTGQLGSQAADRQHGAQAVQISISPTSVAIALPRIGLGLASHGQALSAGERQRLSALKLTHLRLDLHLARPDYVQVLQQGAEQAQALGVALEAAIFVSDAAEQELSALRSLLAALRPPILRWLIFHEGEKSTREPWLHLARQYLLDYDPQAAFGAGSNAYFTELNRGHPPLSAIDLAVYSINPQVHAFDNASLVETLAAQAATVESARAFIGGLPLVISPVTLRPRFNPDATGAAPEPDPNQLPPQVDARQMSLFGAAWTLGSLKYLAESGVYGVTFYETTGWRGLIERQSGSPSPFSSLPGMVFPLYHVFAALSDFRGGAVIACRSSDPLRVEALTLQLNGRRRLLIANMSAEAQAVMIDGLGDAVRVVALDETSAELATFSPEAFAAQAGTPLGAVNGQLTYTLLPYAFVRMDSE